MLARFDPKTSQLASMEQTGDFTYEEGDRKARAAKATLDSDQNLIMLDGRRAHVGCHRVHLRRPHPHGPEHRRFHRRRQREFQPPAGQGPKKNSQMLSGDEPLQAQARKMESTNRNRTIHYEGNVRDVAGRQPHQAPTWWTWTARSTRLVADGHVVSNLWEQPKDDAARRRAPAPVLTVVHAPHLVYTDDNRLAVLYRRRGC